MVYAVLAFVVAFQGRDTSTYKDEQTARLVDQARARHRIQDTLVHDYTASIRTRIDAGFGRSRFARILPIVAMETAARIVWNRPNDLKVTIVGARSASAIKGANVNGSFSDPWFVPRGLGDSIRFVDQELPETPALHPLAPTGPDYYRYAIFDSLTLELPGRRVSAVGVHVEPKRMGPALIAGNLWLDTETLEVVRITFTYLGDFLWSTPDSSTAGDSARARRDNATANRILRVDAELEYALHESRYWMPYRQLVTLSVEIPWFINATIPVHFITTFSDYQVNQGSAAQFTVAPDDSARKGGRCRRQAEDSTCARPMDMERRSKEGYTRAEWWEGGRWELQVPPKDSLAGYQWPDELALAQDDATEQLIRETTATLAKMEQDLPAMWVGRQAAGLALERFSDLVRYNRVQGLSVGAGVRLATFGFSSIMASARYGIADKRPTGGLSFRREAPGGQLELGAWRSVRETDPWTRGASSGNSMNALFAGHDDADYYLASGGSVRFSGYTGPLSDAILELRVEHDRSMATRSHSALNDLLGGSGAFPPNPPVQGGDFLGTSVARRWATGPLDLQLGADGLFGFASSASGLAGGRAWGTARLRFEVAGRGGAFTVRGGTGAGDDIPQLQFRVGGPETVRGYDYGTRSGRSVWSSQLDVALGKRMVISPVVFADAGSTSTSGKPLASAGAGLSILGGFIRFNVAKGLSPKVPIRFDLLFRAPR